VGSETWTYRSGQVTSRKGADIESPDTRYRQSLLLWAAKYGREAVVKLLLDMGADLESRDTEYEQLALS